MDGESAQIWQLQQSRIKPIFEVLTNENFHRGGHKGSLSEGREGADAWLHVVQKDARARGDRRVPAKGVTWLGMSRLAGRSGVTGWRAYRVGR